MKKNLLRKFRESIFLLIAIASGLPSHAAPGYVLGEIEYVRTHNAEVYPIWAPPIFWFTLKGVTSAGTCNKFKDTVMFIGADRQMFTMLLAAQAANLKVTVTFDDTVRKNGYCLATYITTGNPPPDPP